MKFLERALDRLRQWLASRFGNPLEWTGVDKCLMILVVMTVVGTGYGLWLAWLYANPEHSIWIARRFVEIALPVQIGEVLWWVTLFVLGLPLRRSNPEARWFVYTVSVSYALCNALGIYALGQFSTTAGTIAMGNVFVGLLLFDLRVVLVASATALLVLSATALGTAAGVVPYSPMLAYQPYRAGGSVEWWWLTNFGVGTVIFALANLAAFAYIIDRWRDREAKLAEAHVLLQAQKDQLVRAEALASVGSLVSGAAHELRNPLSSSGALLHSLRDDLDGFTEMSDAHRTEAVEALEMALNGQGRASAIVERLYQLTDDLEHERSGAVLGDFLEDLCERYPVLRVQCVDGASELRISASLVQTVLPNLIENALAATGEKGRIELEVVRSDGWLRLEVRDDGEGVPDELKPHIFRPFVTGVRGGGGRRVGLGLYVAHELVSRLGGTIDLESTQGKGTTVRVAIPVPEFA